MASDGILAGFQFNVSHQEIERILYEIEQWWEASHEQAGIEWLPIEGIQNFLMNDLGYEDMDEFEDAIQGPFSDFLAAFPHIETQEVGSRICFKIHMPKPGPARTLTLHVDSTKRLLETTLLKGADAELEIPSLEFSICAERERHIDSLYNHLVAARDKLESHCAQLSDGSAERDEILKTVAGLASCLDVERPFDVVIHDRAALSEFKPSEGVKIEPADLAS
mmetsp:Transcript_70439/g.229020  ORF Transcript_70439/g.229020 Transcript_70439/m.229020 type:complete len:222 (+) Transcript_70439:116-781(+)